jgi:hypothetical protein
MLIMITLKQILKITSLLLPMHFFLINDSTIANTSSFTSDGIMVSKSWRIAQTCWPFNSNAKH